MPALRTDGKPLHVKVKRPKPKAGPPTPTPRSRPAPVSQPGPISNTERKKIKRHKKKPRYGKALQKARVHGPATRRGTSPAGDTKSDADRARGRATSDAAIRAARVRYVRRSRPTGKKLVIRELEGKGVLASTLDKLASKAAPSVSKVVRHQVQPAQASLGLGLSNDRAKKVVEAGAKDLITFPAQAIPSVYVPAAGLVEAAQGDTKRIKQFAKDIDKGDPVYNAGAAAVEKIGGDTKAAKKRLEAAGKAVEEHPGLAALEVAGLKGGVGRLTSRTLRGGGRTVRKAGKVTRSKKVERAGEKIRKAGSTERKPRSVPNTAIVETRAYSRDSFKKAGQVLREKQDRGAVKRITRKADEAKARGDHDVEQELRAAAAKRDPDRVSEAEIKQRVDERIQVNEDTRRRNRATATKGARKIVKRVKREKGALSVVAQRIARADKTDLQAYVRELTAEASGLSRSKLRANRDLRKQLQAVIDDPKADMGRLEAAAKAYEQVTGPVQKKLGALQVFDPKQVERAAVIPYAVRRMGATHDAKLGLLDNKGRPLSTKRVTAHMSRNGESPASFLTQAPSQRGARNFNVRSERPVSANSGKRTGEATRKGTFDSDPETLVEGAAKNQGLVDATEGFRSTVKEFAVRTDKGGKPRVRTFQTKKLADQAARDALHDDKGDPRPGVHALRAVRVNPFAGSKAQLEKLLDDVDNLDSDQSKQIMDSLTDAIKGKDGEGPWALIPEAAADRILDHLNTQGGSGGIKTLQLANQAFRRTVLSTSPSWFAGNLIEGLGRAALAHAGPRSYATARKTMSRLREIDPAMADEALSRLIGGGHFTSADRAHVRRGAQQFEGTAIAPIANALGKFWRSPGPKQAAQVWQSYTEFVFRSLNGRIESGIQTAMLGAALRKSPLMNQRIVKLGKAAVDDAAKGLTKTENQVAFGRQVDIMYGKYGKFSPAMKKAVSTYTPFAAWAINSAYFVYRTLPRDHPIVTSVIAASEQATEEWRKDHGLDLWMQGAVPGFLQGSIPVGKGKLRASRFTPFGAFGSPTETIAGQLNPLLSTPVLALKGLDWTGREMRVKGADGKSRPANEMEKAIAAAHAFATATVPGLSIGERVSKDGPGTLNPLKVVKPPESTKKIKVHKPGAFKGQRKSSKDGGFFGGSSSSSSSSSSGSGFFGGGASEKPKAGSGFFD